MRCYYAHIVDTVPVQPILKSVVCIPDSRAVFRCFRRHYRQHHHHLCVLQSPASHVNPARFQSTAAQPQLPALSRPKHPYYASEQHRVESFAGAQVPRGQSVEVLAQAGFFYVGQWMSLLGVLFLQSCSRILLCFLLVVVTRFFICNFLNVA